MIRGRVWDVKEVVAVAAIQLTGESLQGDVNGPWEERVCLCVVSLFKLAAISAGKVYLTFTASVKLFDCKSLAM